MIKHLVYAMLLASVIAAQATAVQGINGWVTDSYLATFVGPPPESKTGSAHLPAYVNVTVDENQIAVVGWDIKTPERDSVGLLSMLLSTTWESPMEPWEGSGEWFVSSQQMPMSDGSSWFLWYRRTGAGVSDFQLGAPPFISPEQVPNYTVTDQRQRQWSFSQSFLVMPQPSSLDFNEDGSVDESDVDGLVGEIVNGMNNAVFDLTGDGVVDHADLTEWLSKAAIHSGFSAAYLPGDSNLDGAVDAIDLNNLALSWHDEVALWSAGDFTADGSVGPADLNELALSWRQSIPIGTSANVIVPEPSAWLLTLIGSALVCRSQRFRSLLPPENPRYRE